MEDIHRFSKEVLIRKLIALVIIMGVYYNLILFGLAPGVFTNPITLTCLILYYAVGSIDVIIRPLPDEKNITLVEKLIGLLSLLYPFIFALAYYENLAIIAPLIPIWNQVTVAYIGLILLIIGGIIMVISRIQLGKYGTPVVHTGEDHKLVKQGLYKFVRHPMYTGATMMMIAPYLAFRSIIVLIIMIIIYIPIMRMRITMEEETLIGTFGDEYRDYMKRTKRLIPGIF